jgi:hypothetical protein
MTTDVMPQVTAVRVVAPFGLELRFNDHSQRRIDLSRALQTTLTGPVFAPVRDVGVLRPSVPRSRRWHGRLAKWRADLAPESFYEDFDDLTA